MRILLGIGNPGLRYTATRHNIGWAVFEALLGRQSGRGLAQWTESDGLFLSYEIRSPDAEFVLIKPLTFVNLSGVAALKALQQYRVSSEDMLVIIDDVHLSPGDIRLRKGGSSGGHNGMASIIETLGTSAVPRLRVGIGAPPPNITLTDYVLSPFTPEELPAIDNAVSRSAQVAEAFGCGGYAEAGTVMSRLQEQRALESDDTPEE